MMAAMALPVAATLPIASALPIAAAALGEALAFVRTDRKVAATAARRRDRNAATARGRDRRAATATRCGNASTRRSAAAYLLGARRHRERSSSQSHRRPDR
jgi:hypothetical protein